MADTYAEHPLRHPLLACTWQQRPDRAVEHRVVPDGCVDLIWLAGRELVVAGPDTRARLVTLPAGSLTVGVRLRPGAAGAVLGRPADEIRDQDVPAALLWGAPAARVGELLPGFGAPAQRRLLARFVHGLGRRPDPLAAAAVAAITAEPGLRVPEVAARLGVAERTLHRRLRAAVGYGPKTLARVARLRRLAEATSGPLAERALAAGYASQAHMGTDVVALTGLTPVRFLEDAGPGGA